ncbi:MAG: hypothetical protein ABIC04_07445 [Nanoarchaeota archaeon]
MADLNFCPYCDASHYKLMLCKDNVFFCKECNRFFRFEELNFKCPKCDKMNIRKGDFPSPSGEVIFQCVNCKKSTGTTEFFNYNKIK